VAGAPITLTSNGSVNTDWLVTVRPRIGFAFDRTLVYATGGVAIANEKDAFNDTLITTGGGPFTGIAGLLNVTSSRSIGWTAGGGIEYVIAPQWSLKAEYLHLDFGAAVSSAGATHTPMALGPSGFTASVLTVSSHLSADLVRAGLNFKFAL
jgi:outer membrane immunogenic protein